MMYQTDNEDYFATTLGSGATASGRVFTHTLAPYLGIQLEMSYPAFPRGAYHLQKKYPIWGCPSQPLAGTVGVAGSRILYKPSTTDACRYYIGTDGLSYIVSQYIGGNPGATFGVKANKVKNPSTKFLIMDGQMKAGGALYDVTIISTTPERAGFRHSSFTNLAFADGHVGIYSGQPTTNAWQQTSNWVIDQ